MIDFTPEQLAQEWERSEAYGRRKAASMGRPDEWRRFADQEMWARTMWIGGPSPLRSLEQRVTRIEERLGLR